LICDSYYLTSPKRGLEWSGCRGAGSRIACLVAAALSVALAGDVQEASSDGRVLAPRAQVVAQFFQQRVAGPEGVLPFLQVAQPGVGPPLAAEVGQAVAFGVQGDGRGASGACRLGLSFLEKWHGAERRARRSRRPALQGKIVGLRDHLYVTRQRSEGSVVLGGHQRMADIR